MRCVDSLALVPTWSSHGASLPSAVATTASDMTPGPRRSLRGPPLFRSGMILLQALNSPGHASLNGQPCLPAPGELSVCWSPPRRPCYRPSSILRAII